MTPTFLEPVKKVAGVHAVACVDLQGACLAHLAEPPYEPNIITHVVARLNSGADFVGYLDANIGTMIVMFEEGIVVSREFDERRIVVIGTKDITLSMLWVSINVVGLKIPTGGTAKPASGSGDNWGSGVSWTDSSGSIDESERPPPGEGVPRSVLKSLLRAYALQLGPFAKVIMKEQLSKMGVSSHTMRHSQSADLIALLAQKIPDYDKRMEFVAAAKLLLI